MLTGGFRARVQRWREVGQSSQSRAFTVSGAGFSLQTLLWQLLSEGVGATAGAGITQPPKLLLTASQKGALE